MVGREFYHRPEFMNELMPFFGDTPKTTDILFRDFYRFLVELDQQGEPIHHAIRHALGLFAGRPGARKWRQMLSGKPSVTLDDVKRAAEVVLHDVHTSGSPTVT